LCWKGAADLGREIGEGRYGAGGRLPAEGELAERYGVFRDTLRQ
jgi:GntR family transcriptional regulator